MQNESSSLRSGVALAVLGCLVLCACTVSIDDQQVPADLVLRHGKIVTVDGRNTEARALAARNGRIGP